MAEATNVTAPIQRRGDDAIRLERILDAPVETVWRYLTEAKLRQQWFMGGTDAKPDSEFDLLVDHDKLSTDEVPYPETHECFKGALWTEKVIRFERPKLLETTFQGGKSGIVTYELFPQGDRTHLVLTHRGITSAAGFEGFGGGWHSHLTVLEEKLAGRSVRNFWELHARSRELVARTLG